MNDTVKKEYFECECQDMSHTIRMTYFDDDDDFLIYVDIYLQPKPIFKKDYILVLGKINIPVIKFPRIWASIKYLIGIRSSFGDFGELVWDTNKAKKIKSFLNSFIENKEKAHEKSKNKD